MSDAPLKNRENEGSVAVVAVVAVILEPITATAAQSSFAHAEGAEQFHMGAQNTGEY